MFDLFGDPVDENHGKRGRPSHKATAQNRNKVMLLLAMGWSDENISAALCISKPTLNKHYFRELKARDVARLRLKATHMEMLWVQAKSGSVPAIKEFRKLMDQVETEEAEREFLGKGLPSQNQLKPPKLGKKEEAARVANSAGQGTDWGNDLLEVPPGQSVN